MQGIITPALRKHFVTHNQRKIGSTQIFDNTIENRLIKHSVNYLSSGLHYVTLIGYSKVSF